MAIALGQVIRHRSGQAQREGEVGKTTRGMSRIAHATPAILRERGQTDLILSPAGDVIQAFDPKDGRIGGDHYASPIVAGNKIYFLSLEGETVIIETGPEFKILARNSIEERCQASIAISRG